MTLCGLVALGGAACGDDGGSGDGGGDGSSGGEGDACTTFRDCQSGLDCIMGVCTAPLGAVGDACIYTQRCMDNLYCSIPRTCQPEGDGARFSTCTDSGDCESPLVCSLQGDGSYRCVDDGTGDIGPPADSCSVLADCLAGLFCIDGECSATSDGSGDAGMDGGGDAGMDSGGDAMLGGPCEDETDCNDMNACTIDQCVGLMCRNTLTDGDEDGYASSLIGACGLDCNDMDDRVNPDNTEFHTTRHTNPLPLVPDTFDWNCDGREELQYPSRVPECDDSIGGTCTAGEGWAGSPPACGASGQWSRCTGRMAGCRVERVETRTQGCR